MRNDIPVVSAIKIVIFLFTVLFSSGCTKSSDSTDLVTAPVPKNILPLELSGSSPIERARSAVNAFGIDNPDRIRAVVAALAASGVPVIGSDGVPLTGTGEDSIGLPWLHVSSVKITSTKYSLPLSEVIRIFNLPFLKSSTTSNTEDTHILTGLRAGLTSSDPQVQFFSALISESNRRLGGPELSDPSTTAAQILLDAPTIEVFNGRLLRSLLAYIKEKEQLTPATSETASPMISGWFSAQAAPAPVSEISALKPTNSNPVKNPPVDCSNDALDGWGLWLLSKFAAGVDLSKLGGSEFKGIFIETLERASVELEISGKAVATGKAIFKTSGYVTSIMTWTNLIYEAMSISATVTMVDGEPLVRNKKISQGHGKQKTLIITIESLPIIDPDKLDVANCLAVTMAAVGNNTTFSPAAPITNISVNIKGGKGFSNNLVTSGTLVLFGPEEVNLRPSTDAQGQAKIGVQGRQQHRDYPDNAKPVMKSFSLRLSAQLKPTSLSQVGKTFLDSLLCIVTSSCADVSSDIAETIYYDLGEFSFALVDWSSGWKIDETINSGGDSAHYTGISCESEKGPWKITGIAHTSGIELRNEFSGFFDDTGHGHFSGKQQMESESLSATWSFIFDDMTLIKDGESFFMKGKGYTVAAHAQSSDGDVGDVDSDGNIDIDTVDAGHLHDTTSVSSFALELHLQPAGVGDCK